MTAREPSCGKQTAAGAVGSMGGWGQGGEGGGGRREVKRERSDVGTIHVAVHVLLVLLQKGLRQRHDWLQERLHCVLVRVGQHCTHLLHTATQRMVNKRLVSKTG